MRLLGCEDLLKPNPEQENHQSVSEDRTDGPPGTWTFKKKKLFSTFDYLGLVI